jgi:enoyl-[acyl-carrier protein] reductase II
VALNQICSIFGVGYPIIQGGLLGISCPELAAAASEAGALGMLSGEKPLGELRNEIGATRQLTDKPFGVNLPVIGLRGRVDEVLELVIEEGVEVIATAAGSPDVCTARLKEAGVAVMHVCSTVDHARKAEAAGVDAVVAEGVESGGLQGVHETTTLVLVPQVVDAVSIPVIAAGGIGDERGFVAALALGASGIQMGTRFIATRESPVALEYKQAILVATDTSTEISGRDTRRRARSLRADVLSEIQPEAEGRFGMGEVAGLIGDCPTVAEVIESMVRAVRPLIYQVRDDLADLPRAGSDDR